MSPRKARRLPPGIPRRPRGGARTPAGGEGGKAPLPRLGPDRVESAPDGDWVVRAIPGEAAIKTYRCPGCDQEIRAGTPHVVAWPAVAPGVEQRRHWHGPCWQRRLDRRVPARRARR